ncbi:MAG: hypothetical protein SD837_15895 [Candidatus Electrothrix scaldis]|nr:MAG: hypothetical protein SD837_15895 [Candidatus Electrothrix sp. GW3-3]
MIKITGLKFNNCTIKNSIAVLILFAISVGYLVPVLSMRVGLYDEGIVLTGADRILKGDIPYRDFWTIYTPGQYYTLAFLFKVFGSSILVERIYDIFVKAAISVLSFVIVLQLDFSRKVALVSWAMSLFWVAYMQFAVYPVYPALLLIYLSINSYFNYIRKYNIQSLIFCAVFIAITALFRHDFGAMAFLAVTITIFIKIFFLKEGKRREIVYFIGAVFIVSLPFLAIAWMKIGLNVLVNQMILLPAEIMPKYRWVPYPDLSFINIEFYVVPLVVFIGNIIGIALILKKQEKNNLLIQGILLVSLLGFFLLNQVRVRSDLVHLLPAAIVSFLLVPFIWRGFYEVFSLTVSRIMYLLVIIMFSASFFKAVILNKRHSLRYRNVVAVELSRAGCASIPLDLQYTISYIQNNTSKNDSIYVGVTDHDQFIANDTIIYYLSERNYATRFNQFDPGVSNTLDAQKIIIGELERKKTNLLVLSNSYWYEPNETRFNFNVNIIDNYIKKCYNIDKVIGKYLVLKRKNDVQEGEWGHATSR